jgi:hypothetical protein
MNVAEYKARRAAVKEPVYRESCPKCWKSIQTCFCAMVRPFESPLPFVIVQHLDEARNPIATARMAHMSLTISTLIMDNEFGDNHVVDSMLADKTANHVILYPSPDAAPIEEYFDHEAGKPPVFWILDTTWSHVPKMLRLSPPLKTIPMAKFTPDVVSKFQIRKQPNPMCLSTIESMYLVIERYMKHHRLDHRDHDALINVFQYMVDQQIRYSREKNSTRHQAMRAARAARAALKASI